jgi:sirohydrochlorin cobaltochelatase
LDVRRALSEAALMLFAIGSSRSAGPVRSLDQHARVLASLGLFRQVRTAVMIGGPSPQQALQDLQGGVYIVPMMMCTGWIWSTQIPTALGLSGASSNDGSRTVQLCGPLGHRLELGLLVGLRAQAAAQRHGVEPKQTTLLIVAHGTDRDRGSQHATDRHAARVRETGAFAEVQTAYLDQAPTIPDTVAGLKRPTVVAGLFATPGPHAEQDVPRLIAQGNSPNVIDYLGPIGADGDIPNVVLNIVAHEVTRHTTRAHAEILARA